MNPIMIKPDIYWVGAKDWSLTEFHGYSTGRGTTYNAYLIIDDKITLVDTVKAPFAGEMFERIKTLIDPSKIDYVVCNHVEMDHSGVIPKVLEFNPKATIISSPNGDKGLRNHFFKSHMNIKTVESGEVLKIGKRSLTFLHMPMVHWPDSMATYVAEEKLLLPNDAFGQHYAGNSIFSSESPRDIVFEEAAKYYANIVYPYGAQVKKVLDAVSKLDIDMIAPSHGVIFDSNLNEIISRYNKWSGHEHENRALVVYDTMWGSTASLASSIKSVFENEKIPVTVRSLSHSHYSDIITEVLESKYVFIGSPVLNGEVLPTTAAFLSYLRGLKPKNKIGFVFGSYGWSPIALKNVGDILESLKWKLPEAPFTQKYVPTSENLDELKQVVLKVIKSGE